MKIDFDPAKSERNTKARSLSLDRATKPLTDKSGEVRELTGEDMKRFRPAAEVLPQEFLAVLPKRKPGQRGAQKRPTKEPVTVRYSRDVLEYFRTAGPGWQARIDAALKEWVAQHRQSSER